MKTITLSIPNIHCHHCLMTIQRESKAIPGIEFVSGDVEHKTATFQITDDEALTRLKAILTEVGYPAAD